MKPQGRIRGKVTVGSVLTIILVVGLMTVPLLSMDTGQAAGRVVPVSAGDAGDAGDAEQAGGNGQAGNGQADDGQGENAQAMPGQAALDGAAGKRIYLLSGDRSVQRLPVGTRGESVLGTTGVLTRAGEPTLTTVENPFTDNVAIHISGRRERWYAPDFSLFLAELVNISANEYTLFISGSAAPGATVSLRGMDEPWNRFYTVTADRDGNFYIMVTVSDNLLHAAEGGARQFTMRGFRLQPDDYEDLTLYEFAVLRK